MFLLYLALSAAILMLNLKIGIILGLLPLSRKALFLPPLFFGLAAYFLMLALAGQKKLLTQIINDNPFICVVAAAILFIYLGLQKQEQEITVMETKIGQSRLKCLSFLQCFVCVVAMGILLIIAVPAPGEKITAWSAAFAIVWALIITGVAFGTRTIIRRAQFRPIIVFNSLLLFVGVLTLGFAFIFPNVEQAMALQFDHVQTPSFIMLVWVAAGFTGLTLLGYFKYRNNTRNGR